MHVALSQVISNSLSLSQTASRCTQLAHRTCTSTLMLKHTLVHMQGKHTRTPTYKHTLVIRGTKKRSFLNKSFHTAILTISDRRILLSPKTLSLFHGCLMMFYHALGIMFTFPCMFKKRFKKNTSLQNTCVS